MILTCEQCDTRFRLDESRLPAKGARVRCSRCKHSFFVRPPGVSQAEAIDAIAAEAAHTAKPAKADVAWDLDEGADPGSTLQRARSAPAPAPPSDLADESDWRFEDEVPQLGDSGASLDLPNGEAPALSGEPDANESSFAQLGDPESWDLLSTTDPGDQAGGAPPAAGRVDPPAARRERPPPPELERPRPAAVAATPPAETRIDAMPIVAIEPTPHQRSLGHGVAALLAVLVLAGSLHATPSHVVAPPAMPIGTFAIEKLHARLVDNVWTGPVWVVSGELHNATAQPHRLDAAVGVVLLDRNGVPIEGAVALAQPALDASRLGGEDPVVLHEQASDAAAALATRSLAPDARVAFDAVFPSAPRGAARFAVQQRPAPALPEAHEPSPAPPTDPAAPLS